MKHTTRTLQDAVHRLRRAVTDPGDHPEYHARQIALLRRNWPALWEAVNNLLYPEARGNPLRREALRVGEDPLVLRHERDSAQRLLRETTRRLHAAEDAARGARRERNRTRAMYRTLLILAASRARNNDTTTTEKE